MYKIVAGEIGFAGISSLILWNNSIAAMKKWTLNIYEKRTQKMIDLGELIVDDNAKREKDRFLLTV